MRHSERKYHQYFVWVEFMRDGRFCRKKFPIIKHSGAGYRKGGYRKRNVKCITDNLGWSLYLRSKTRFRKQYTLFFDQYVKKDDIENAVNTFIEKVGGELIRVYLGDLYGREIDNDKAFP